MLTGIGLIIGGFLFTLGADLYTVGKAAVLSLPLQFAIPIALTAAGFGLILYDILSRRRKARTNKEHEQSEADDGQNRRERRWRFFPANYR